MGFDNSVGLLAISLVCQRLNRRVVSARKLNDQAIASAVGSFHVVLHSSAGGGEWKRWPHQRLTGAEPRRLKVSRVAAFSSWSISPGGSLSALQRDWGGILISIEAMTGSLTNTNPLLPLRYVDGVTIRFRERVAG